MAAKTKKIVLFLVEGPTDEDTFSAVMKKIYAAEHVVFHVAHEDVTSNRETTSLNAVISVNEHVSMELKRYGLKKADVLEIIHLVDTDGALVPEEAVVFGDVDELTYEQDRIVAPMDSSVLHRNSRKAMILRKLYSTSKVAGRPYRVYYLSRNLEHVLHNDPSRLSTQQKIDYADAFSTRYGDDPEGFIALMSNSEFTVTGSYRETWEFIEKETNSLHRHSNLHLALIEHDDTGVS